MQNEILMEILTQVRNIDATTKELKIETKEMNKRITNLEENQTKIFTELSSMNARINKLEENDTKIFAEIKQLKDTNKEVFAEIKQLKDTNKEVFAEIKQLKANDLELAGMIADLAKDTTKRKNQLESKLMKELRDIKNYIKRSNENNEKEHAIFRKQIQALEARTIHLEEKLLPA